MKRNRKLLWAPLSILCCAAGCYNVAPSDRGSDSETGEGVSGDTSVDSDIDSETSVNGDTDTFVEDSDSVTGDTDTVNDSGTDSAANTDNDTDAGGETDTGSDVDAGAEDVPCALECLGRKNCIDNGGLVYDEMRCTGNGRVCCMLINGAPEMPILSPLYLSERAATGMLR